MTPPFPQPFDTNDGRRLTIHIARSEDREEIYDLILNHFVARPPMFFLFHYDHSMSESQREQSIRDHITRCTSLPISLIVRNEVGRLVAVRLNLLEDRLPDGAKVEGRRLNLRLAFHAELNKGIDLYSLLETDRILHLAMLAVAPDYGQHGIGTRLYQLSMDVAIANGAGGMKVEAASVYVVQLAKKLGFKTHKTINTVDTEFLGIKPLAGVDLGEHRYGVLMARRLP